MAIALELTIEDEGLLSSSSLISLLSRIEHTFRNAAAITSIRLANEIGLSPAVAQLTVVRLWSHEQSFFWIETVSPGSKKFLCHVIAPAVIAMLLTSTVGESVKEGWRRTEAHAYISSSIPKIERYLVEEFERLFNNSRGREDDFTYDEPVIVRRDDDDFLIEIRSHERRRPKG